MTIIYLHLLHEKHITSVPKIISMTIMSMIYDTSANDFTKVVRGLWV